MKESHLKAFGAAITEVYEAGRVKAEGIRLKDLFWAHLRASASARHNGDIKRALWNRDCARALRLRGLLRRLP